MNHFPKTPEKKTVVFLAGVCLCTGSGLTLASYTDALLLLMRGIFRPKTPQRELLVSGHIVIRILGNSLLPEDDEDVDLLASLEGTKDDWWHIGLNYLSPFKPTLMSVKPVEKDDETVPSADRVFIESTYQFANVFEMMQRYTTTPSLTASFYQLEESQRRIGAFLPQPVPILALRSGTQDAFQLWPKTKKARAKANPPRGRRDDEDCEGDEEPQDEEPLEEEEVHADLGIAADMLLEAYEALVPIVPVPPPAPLPNPPLVQPPSSAAASSSNAPPVLNRQAVQANRGVIGKALATVHLATGTISYYERGDFLAVCKVDGHGRCTKTRKGESATAVGPTATGRPLGFLAAWLAHGSMYADKAEHYTALALTIPHDVRTAARAELSLHEGAMELFAFEKGDLGDDEPLVSC